jgi:pimeloyl-ACP methyl ester carboxylesterase
MPFATGHGGARIHYEVTGEKSAEPVVLIQGLGLGARFWFDMPRRLVDAGYRVVVLDNRGVGKSDRPRGPYRVHHMADDVAHVLEASGVGQANVVGISLGGMIAQEVALRHPARVRGLVLLATTAGLPHARLPSPKMLKMLVTMPFKRNDPAHNLLLLPEHELHRAGELLKEWPGAIREEPLSLRSFVYQLAGVALHSTGFRLKKIKCPTVVVHGTGDLLIPAANSAVIAGRIPRARLEIIDRCGHGIPILDEEVVARALRTLRC